jgi:hypothetical protein
MVPNSATGCMLLKAMEAVYLGKLQLLFIALG